MKKKIKITRSRTYKTSPGLEPLMVPVDSVRLDENNARLHPERSIAALAAALTRFGYQKPIVINKNGVVIAGNGILMAATRIGWTHIPVTKTQLDGADATAYAIADNRVAEHSEWDFKRLAAQLSEVGHEISLGFDEVDYVWAMKQLERVNDAAARPERKSLDTAIEYRCPRCKKEWVKHK